MIAGESLNGELFEESPDSTGQEWWITSTWGDPQESATESKPPFSIYLLNGKGETVV